MRIHIITDVNNKNSEDLKEFLTSVFNLTEISEPRWELYKILDANVSEEVDIELIKAVEGVHSVEGDDYKIL